MWLTPVSQATGLQLPLLSVPGENSGVAVATASTLTCCLHWMGPHSKHKWRKSGAEPEADFLSVVILAIWFQNPKFWNLF